MTSKRVDVGTESDNDGKVFEDTDFTKAYEVTDTDGNDKDLDAANEVRYTISKSQYSDTATLNLTKSGGDITTRDDNGNGTFEMAVVDIDNTDMPGEENYWYELEVEDKDGKEQVVYYGTFEVSGSNDPDK